MADDARRPAYDLTPTQQDLKNIDTAGDTSTVLKNEVVTMADTAPRVPYDLSPVLPNSKPEYSAENLRHLVLSHNSTFTPRVMRPSEEVVVITPPTAEEFMARVTAASDRNRERMKIEEEQFTHYTNAMRDPMGGYMSDGEAERDWLLLKYVPALASERSAGGNADWVLPDAVSLRAYSRKLIGQDWFEEHGFTLYDLYEGLRRLRLSVPGHEVDDENSWAAGILRKASRIE